MFIVRSFCRTCHFMLWYSCLLLWHFNKWRKWTSHNIVTFFFKVLPCYPWKPNFHYIHSATEILIARKEIFTGIHESRIHHDSVWNPLPFAPHPLSDWNEMCLKLKWNTSHAATVGPRLASIPGVKSIHYLSSWPVPWPPLQLSCWTAIALNSLGLPQLTNDSQLLSKTGADNKGLILNNAAVVVF